MKKRILSAILVLAMVLSMAPAVVTAAPVETTQSPKAGTHAATGHTCESEGCGTTEWKAWPTDGTIPTSGHYYLTQNVKLNGQLGLSNKTLHICLNGYVMTAKANTRLGWLYGTSKLVITDCTAYEENGVYYAGALTGGVDKVTSTGGGGAFYVYANATLELHDGKITNCSSITGGGAIYNNGIVKLYGGELSGNVAASGTSAKHGGAIFNNVGGVLTAENVRFHDNHADNGEGGAFQNWGNATFTGCTFTGNNAATGGAMNLGGTNKTVLIDGCTFTGNTAGVVSAINNKIATGSITIKDTEITGNSNTGGFGTVNVLGSAKAVILQGKVVITGNTTGEDTPNNLHVQDGDTEGVDVSALTAGSSISVHLRGARTRFTTANEANNASYFTADVDGKIVTKDANNRLQLETYVAPKHSHCVCGTEGCADHETVAYTEWNDATKLPETAGNYYLTTDVVVSYRASLSDGDVKLCLNGHSITAAASYTNSRAFYLRNAAKLTLTDCNENAGKISGFTSTPLMFDSSCTDVVLDLYNIQVSGNNSTKTGSAIILQGAGTFNLHSGSITGNKTTASGTIYLGGKVIANLLGGEISGNTVGGNGGGIYTEGTNAKINLTGTAITGNTAGTNGGGILMKNQLAQMNISDDAQVTGNTAKDKPSNLYLSGTGLFTAGKLSEKGNVGISADNTFRAVSQPTDQDVSTGYFSDDKALVISYEEGALFLGAPDGHSHCACAGENNLCDHAAIKFAAWTDATKLPESGNWYLTTDVVVTYRAGLTDTNLKLCLNGHTIRVADSYAKGRAFYVYGNSQVILTDCNDNPGMFTGAKASAIAFDTTCDGAQLDLHNITFTGNASTMGGGALMVQGNAVVNIYSGTYRGNTTHTLLKVDANNQPVLNANGDEQAANNVGGGAIASHTKGATVNIYGGTFTENKAYALTLKKADGTTTVAGGSGGAIYAKGDLTIYEGVEIFGNEAENNGGGVCFGGNEAFFTMHGGSITGNAGKAGGGVIMLNRSTFNLMEGKITGNSGTRGGGVYVSINAAMNMDGGEISGNTVSGDAGGLYAYASVVTLNGGAIRNNKASGNGGAISSGNGTITVDGVKVTKGAVITINKGAAITGNFAEKNAGGIQISGKESVLTLSGGAVNGNTCKASAGGVLVLNYAHFELKSGSVDNNQAKACGGVYISTNTSFKMTGGTVSGNVSKTSTGGVHFWRSKGVMSGGSVSNNTAQGGNAGGIYLQGSSLQLTGTYIGYNKALKGNGGGVSTGQATVKKNGVVKEKYQCDLLLGGSVIEHNEAKNGGGAILLSYTKCRLTAGAIRNNKATTSAGGAYVSANADMKMTGGSVTDNQAAANGGGLYHYSSTGSYTGGKIQGNTCVGNGANFYSSGANAKVYVKGYDFTGLTAYNGSVAAVQSMSVLTMEDCKLYDNAASGFGTVYIGTNSFGNFTNCKFYSNKSTKQGGAIYGAQNATATITDCIFTENTAGTDGGAICCRGSFYMTNCQVTDNTASGNGGGIATGKCGIRGSKFQDGLVLTNVTVTDNISGGQGGGLYLSTGCKTTMTDVTITGNESALEGGAFWAVDDTTLHNVTVTGNTSGGKGYAAWYDYSIYDGHSYFVGVHLISGDIIIRDNNGGNVYLDQQVAMSVDYRGLGENTEFGIQLDAGVLTNRLFGEYNYEGGNQAYTVTYGSRSLTEPEVDASIAMAEESAQQAEEKVGNVTLYVLIGVLALAIVAVAVILVKKAGKAAQKANKE